MIRKLFYKCRLLTVVLAVSLAACGGAEWPPPGGISGNSGRTDRPMARNSAAMFVNADAVFVGKGDTVYAISRRHRVSVRAIIEANHLTPPYYLTVGQRLVLPRRQIYKVKSGDTLGQIAKAYDVDMYDMARINNLRPPYVIHIDERLFLPDFGSVAGPVQTAKKSRSVTTKTMAEPPPPSRKSISSTALKIPPKAISAPPPKIGRAHV